ncbi:hypothetical protein KCU65_g6221, partial [Aureobasidium melanogenum]
MAEPNAPSLSASVASTTTAIKRSSNGDDSPDKRQKTTQQKDGKPIYDLNIVVLKHKGILMTQVPLLNFQTLAAEKVKDLVEVSGDGTQGWRFYIYDVSATCPKVGVNQWANADYQDALIDTWIVWLRNDKPAGSLDVYRLRRRVPASATIGIYSPCTSDLANALILYHDTEVGMRQEASGPQIYRATTCEAVRELAQKYFSKPEREPKDPLQLSADEFCQKYHSHHKKNLPCYRTKKLPQQTPSA